MRSLISILIFAGVFVCVFAWRRATVHTPPAVRPPFPGAEVPGELLPGSPVTARLIRGGLLVDGDLADPLEDVQLYRLGAPEVKVSFSGGWTSPIRAIWFFDVDPASRYRVEIRTRHRSMAEVLQPGAIEPLELQRVHLHVKVAPGGGPPLAAAFSPDGAWLGVGANAGDFKLLSTPGDQTRIDLHNLGKVTRVGFSPDSKRVYVFAEGLPHGAQAYDIATGKESSEKAVESSVPLTTKPLDVLASSEDGRWIVKPGAAAGSMALFDAHGANGTPKLVYSVPHTFLALSRDGRYIAVIDERNLASATEEADVDVIVMQ